MEEQAFNQSRNKSKKKSGERERERVRLHPVFMNLVAFLSLLPLLPLLPLLLSVCHLTSQYCVTFIPGNFIGS